MSVRLWLNPGGEVKVADKSPNPRGHAVLWLPVFEEMTPEEANAVLTELTKVGYYGQRIYSPQVSPDDYEVQQIPNAATGEEGLLLARFDIDVKRALYRIRSRKVS